MYQLGGQALFLSANDVQIARGETLRDATAELMSFISSCLADFWLVSALRARVELPSVGIDCDRLLSYFF